MPGYGQPPSGGGFGQPPGGGGFGQPPGGGGYGQPPGGGGYGQPPGGGGGYGAPPGSPIGQPGPAPGGYGAPRPPAASGGPSPNFLLWIILGFVTAFMCGNVPFGVIGGILALIAQSDWNQGNVAGASSKLKFSKLATIVGFGLIALAVIAYIVFIVVVVAAAPSSSSYSY